MKNSFKELKLDELLVKRTEVSKKYFDLRFQAVVGHLENPLEKRTLRRQIARLETRIRAAKASPEAAPAAAEAKPAKAKAAKSAAAKK